MVLPLTRGMHMVKLDIIEERLHFAGMIKIREFPLDATLEDWLAWWPRLSEKEKDRYTLAESHNLLTTSGRTQLLQFAGNNTGTAPFSQYLAIGTGTINSVSAGDTSILGEIYRQVPNTATITGTQNDIATVIGTNTAPGTWTNCGFYGVAATSTAGTGTLLTHALLSYPKVNGTPVTIDYVISVN